MKKVGKQMKKRKKALSFSAAVLLGATLTATSMSNIVFAENTFSHSINTEDTSYLLENMEKDTDAGFTRLEINNGLDIDICSDIPQNQNNSGNLLNNVSIIEVPESALYMEGTTVMGITKQWFREYCSENNSSNPAYLKITIPSHATSIGTNAFCTNKANYDGDDRYNYIHPSNYKIAEVDFSSATSLKSIESQAFKGNNELAGVITLPSSLKTLGKYAFGSCTKLEGMYLPEGLQEIGNANGGSVFKDSSSLKFVRVAGSNSTASIELPDSLISIGQDAFSGAMTSATPTPIVIPEQVSYIGDSAFETPAVTMITVQANDVSNYNGKAFISADGSYSLNGRMTVFQNYAAYSSFPTGGLQSYRKSLTYEFTLNFGENGTQQQKLNNQTVQCVKDSNGQWYIDETYTLPEAPSIDVDEGYTGGWKYRDEILTIKTVLSPNADVLTVEAGQVLMEPTVTFTVDGIKIDTQTTYPKLNLSNHKEHKIGVDVSHPLEGEGNQEGYVVFEYEWTDVYQGGKQGPRMSESGFGRYNLWDNPDVTNTITIDGPTHERTTGDYSGEDYGDGYYLVEVYGYFVHKQGGLKELFYKSASTVIGSDPDRTTNTAYLFDVVTSNPAQQPNITVMGNEVTYGYDTAEIVADVQMIDGQTNTYQWYQAEREGQTEGGNIIYGADSTQLNVESGKNAGNYYYYLEVTSTKTLNGDVLKTVVPITFQVNQAESTIVINDNLNKIFNGEMVQEPQNITQTGSQNTVSFVWYEKQENGWVELQASPVNAGEYKVVAIVAEDTNYKSASAEKIFHISQANNAWKEELSIIGWTYGEQENVPNASAQFGTVTYSYCDSENGIYSEQVPTQAGTYWVKAVIEESNNYAGLEAKIPFEIAQADTKLYINKTLDQIYNGQKAKLEDADLMIQGSTGKVTYQYQIWNEGQQQWLDMEDAPVNAGKYKVVVTVAADTNYHSASVEKEFIISKAESTFIIHDALDKQYDGQSIQIPTNITRTGSQAEPIYEWYIQDANEWRKLDTVPSEIGNYKLAVIIPEDENYNSVTTEKEFCITEQINLNPDTPTNPTTPDASAQDDKTGSMNQQNQLDTPPTGDTNTMAIGLWASLAGISASVLTFLGIKRRRYKK